MLHDFDISFITQVSWTTLWSIVHDCNLNFLSNLISHCNSTIDWVIVSRHLNTFILMINNLSFLHFKTIRISPENTFWIKIIIHFPVDSHIFAQIIINWDSADFNIKLYQFFEKIWRKPDSDNCALLSRAVVAALESDWVLINKLTLLVNNIRSVIWWIWILFSSWSKLWF